MKTMIISLFLVSSAFAIDPASYSKERKALAALDKSIESLAAQNITCKTDSGCEDIWYSDRGCGERFFVLTSRGNANLEEIKYLAGRSNERGVKYGEAADDVECVEYEAFDLKCVEKKCTTVTSEEERKRN